MNSSNRKLLILVAEDDPGVNKLISKNIERMGHKAINAYDGPEVLNIVSEKPVDLLLLDYKMPTMHGLEVVGKLQETKKLPAFIVMTGNGDMEVAIEMMKLGALDFIIKDQDFHNVYPAKIESILLHLETKLKLVESQKALKSSEKKSHRILEAMNDPVYICNSENEIEYANPIFRKYWNDSYIGSKCHEVIYNRKAPCKGCLQITSDDTYIKNTIIKDAIPGKIFQLSFGPINYTKDKISRLNIFRDITELSNAKEASEKNERKFRFLAENSIDIIWQMDLKLKFTYVSPSSVRILGVTPGEIEQRNLWEFASRKYFIQMARQFLDLMNITEKKEYISFESKVITNKNSSIPVEITAKPLTNNNGKLIGLQGAIKDISERVEVQEKLKSQHNLLETLINNMPDQIYIKDLESKYILNNKSHMAELGVSSHTELTNKSDFDFFEKEIAQNYYRDEKRLIETDKALINKEEIKVSKNGKSRWSLTTKVPIHDAEGKVVGIAGINRDITERKEHEREIIKSRYLLGVKNNIANLFLTSEREKLYMKILIALLDELDSKAGFIGYLNEDGDLYCAAAKGDFQKNEKLSEQYLLAHTEFKKNSLLLPLVKKKSLLLNSIPESKKEYLNFKNLLSIPILSNDNKTLGIIVIANKNVDYTAIDKEMLEGLCGYIAPILAATLNEERMKILKEEAFRELKFAKEKAEESEKLKTAFLLNLSHELRTPLNSIMGFSNLLVQKFKDDEKTANYAELINLSGQDLIKMVEDTIEIARLENNEMHPEFENINLTGMLNEIYQEFIVYYGSRYPELNFTLNIPEKNIIIYTDHHKLRKIFWKILDNAGKYTEVGTVELGCTCIDDKSVSVTVNDTGIGIPSEMNMVVFEKFRKIDGTKKFYRGNGLGLSISKGIINLLGGDITLKSELGKGTLVTISIPMKNSMEKNIQKQIKIAI